MCFKCVTNTFTLDMYLIYFVNGHELDPLWERIQIDGFIFILRPFNVYGSFDTDALTMSSCN